MELVRYFLLITLTGTAIIFFIGLHLGDKVTMFISSLSFAWALLMISLDRKAQNRSNVTGSEK